MPNVTTVEGHDVDPGRPFPPSFVDYTKPGLAERKDERLVRESERGRVAAEMRTPAPLPAWRLTRVVRYVDARLDHKIRLADLAKEVRLSRMHFAAQFNAATGLRPLEYVTRRRITRAQELLVRSEQSIVQIALAVGFQTQAHFTTVFRRFVGETPYRWRLAMGDSRCESDRQADVHPQDGPAPGSYVCIAISDNGCGMSDDVLKRAFEPFVTTKPPGRGAGLGLALVRRFIDQSEGHVDIKSNPGIGTVIRMYLPAQHPPCAAAGQTSGAGPDPRTRMPRPIF